MSTVRTSGQFLTRMNNIGSVYVGNVLIDNDNANYTIDTTTVRTITINCASGYSLNPLNDVAPTFNYGSIGYQVGGVGTKYLSTTDTTATFNSDYTQVILDFTNDSNFLELWNGWSGYIRLGSTGAISATQAKQAQTFTITENLTDSASDNTDSTIVEGSNKSIIYTPNSGKEFNLDLCTCVNGEFTVATKYLIQWDITNCSGNVVNTIVAQTPIVYYSVTENLTNCSGDENNPIQIEENTNFSLTYYANNGYRFNNVTANIGTITISNDGLTATITGVATENITVTATTKAIHYVYITGTLTHCTCNYIDGEEVNVNKPIVITANNGYDFKGVYKYRESRGTTQVFSKQNDNTVLTISIFTDDRNYTLYDTYNATKISELVSGFVNLYKVTNSELKSLSVARFVIQSGETVDFGSFITQLYVLPFDIDESIIGETDTIILGNYDSNVNSTLLTDSKLYIDGGIITVPNKYNNVYDYLNTTCTLRLPFFNPIIIDVDNVINKTIGISYIVDLYSGNCTVEITSSFTGEIIHSETTNIVTQIPFIQKQNNSIVNQLSNVNENLIDNAFIEITRNIPYYASGDIFGKTTIVFDTISSVTGYAEISDVKLITTATNEEKEEIENILKDGIFIKESEVINNENI